MAEWLINAKHAPPVSFSDAIERERLIAKMEAHRHRRLLVVQAPAGYGKSLVLSQWHDRIRRSGACAAWISLERSDAGDGAFVTAMILAFANAGIVDRDDTLLPSTGRTAMDSLDALIARMAAMARETWLIIDDWHLAQSSAATALLETLLRRIPVNWHVILASRERPQLALAALRASGQMIVFGAEDLRFSLAEMIESMKAARLSDAAFVALWEQTEGWPIAVRLSSLWLQEGHDAVMLQPSFLAAIDGMADYLGEEIFSALSNDVRDFLIEISICGRFDAHLADAVRESADATRHMDGLRSLGGLIVADDGEPGWFRWHPIFAEFLARRRRSLAEPRLRQLHSRAAGWFEQHDRLDQAVDHARSSGDRTDTIRLVESANCVDLCIRTGASAVRTLLEKLPLEAIRERPRLQAAYAAINLKQGSIAQAQALMTELRAGLRSGGRDTILERDILTLENLWLCFIDTSPTAEELADHQRRLAGVGADEWWLRGLMYNVQGRLEMRAGRLQEACETLEQAYAIFAEGGSAHGCFFMSGHVALCHLFLGKLSTAEGALQRARTLLDDAFDGEPVFTGIWHSINALLLYERNALPAAWHSAQLALTALEQAEGCFEQYLVAVHVGASAAFALSGLDAAKEIVSRGRKLAQYHGFIVMDCILDDLSARLHAEAGLWQAPALSGARTIGKRDRGWLESSFFTPVFCLAAIEERRLDEAKSQATAMIGQSRAGGRIPAEIRGHLLLALACAAAENDVRTHEELRLAIALATPEGILQPFFELEGGLLRLLRELSRQQPSPLSPAQASFLSSLILRVVATDKARDRGEQLTAREREILGHLISGVSNKVIARALDLTENAVKFHLKNVFRKLGVESRVMAAAVAEQMASEQSFPRLSEAAGPLPGASRMPTNRLRAG